MSHPTNMNEANVSTSGRVFLNPDFGKTHINPKFFKPNAPEHIHVNPDFPWVAQKLRTVPSMPPHVGTIVAKSRTKLVRAPVNVDLAVVRSTKPLHPSPITPHLIKIGSRKLVRGSLIEKQTSQNIPVKKVTKLLSKNSYKIDRRQQSLKLQKQSFVSKYALSRATAKESLTPKRVTRTSKRVCRLENTLAKGKSVLNINGVLYKSSKTKLEKAVGSPPGTSDFRKIAPYRQPMPGRLVFVRGNKFVLEKGGRSLTRAEESSNPFSLKRIDIGGLTYVANSQGTFIRTENHKTWNYLSATKQKSINCLSRHLTKSNIPCAIFRKVGKCAAHERGKCPKVHDRKQVAICPKFLKGECLAEKCLLSHEVSLAKMPTCKYFLQGCCTRSACPYLHKKLNENTEICIEFSRGFCSLAEKCNKRHEYVSSELTAKAQPNNAAKYRIRKKSARETTTEKKDLPGEMKTENNVSRYFSGSTKKSTYTLEETPLEASSEAARCVREYEKKPKLGDLPAFIPL